jgi:tagatose-1,6-bisphosphate aldolase non-catalytic subunit AgaZ/GatZ
MDLLSLLKPIFYIYGGVHPYNPHHCVLNDWDPEDFCKLLNNNRIVLFVDDSTVYQTAMTLKAMIYSHYASINNSSIYYVTYDITCTFVLLAVLTTTTFSLRVTSNNMRQLLVTYSTYSNIFTSYNFFSD